MKVPLVLAIGELEVGGTQRQMLELAKRLDRNMFLPQVLCFSDSLAFADAFREAEINVSVVEKKSRYDVGVVSRLKKFFKREGTQVLITFGFTADLWCRVAARVAKVPLVMSSVRTSSEDSKARDWVNRALRPLTDHYIVNSRAVAQYLCRIGVAADSYSIISNGLDFDRFEDSRHISENIRSSLEIDASSFVVGTVSRLSREKNLEGFLRLAQQFSLISPEALFLIIGKGPDEARLRLLADQLGISAKIRWLGERNDVPYLLNAFDLAMLTSKREGLSNTLLEYMAASLPIVSSNVGGNGELIRNGQTGFLYPIEDPNQALDYMVQLYREPALRHQIASEAHRDVVRHFGVRQLVSQTEELILRLWEQKGEKVPKVLSDSVDGDVEQHLANCERRSE